MFNMYVTLWFAVLEDMQNGTQKEDDYVENMLDKFDTLSSNSADVLEFIGTVSKETFIFLKLGIPVAKLIVGAMDVKDKVT